MDPPIVDSSDGFLYVVSGDNGANAVVVQATLDLGSARVATIGPGNLQDVHMPAFNDAYFSSGEVSSWMMYACGYGPGGNATLYGIGFDPGRNLSPGTPGNALEVVSNREECSPLMEFLAGSNRLFLGLLSSSLVEGFVIDTFPAAPFASVSESGGTSGFTADNTEAASIYFGSLASKNAVKLTQSSLQ